MVVSFHQLYYLCDIRETFLEIITACTGLIFPNPSHSLIRVVGIVHSQAPAQLLSFIYLFFCLHMGNAPTQLFVTYIIFHLRTGEPVWGRGFYE